MLEMILTGQGLVSHINILHTRLQRPKGSLFASSIKIRVWVRFKILTSLRDYFSTCDDVCFNRTCFRCFWAYKNKTGVTVKE